MGSTGDRAASLTIEGRRACTGRRAALIASERLRAPVNPSVNSLKQGVARAAGGLGACAAYSINLPTNAYDAAFRGMRTKPELFGRLGGWSID